MASMSNMLISEGNLRAAAAGYIGAKSQALAITTAETPWFGLRNAGYIPPGQLVAVNRPMAISQLRMKFFSLTAFTAGSFAFEAHKTTTTANYTTGGISPQVTAIRKKTSGYEAIPTSEIDIQISAGGGLSGGSQTIVGGESNPFDMAVGGSFDETRPAFESIWLPQDGFPLVLEQDEGLIIHNANAFAAGTGVLFVGVDFYRF